jgi:hypothetical protein
VVEDPAVLAVVDLMRAAYANGRKLQRDRVYRLLEAAVGVPERGMVPSQERARLFPPEKLPALRTLAGPYGDVFLMAKLRSLGYRPVWSTEFSEDRWIKQ